jgi:microcystin-dependent protein
MGEPFLAEVRMLSFGFAPRGWALCDGQILPISQNPALHALIGNLYGGDAVSAFALPDLRGRTPIHRGGAWTEGQKGGQEAHALTAAEMPKHLHAVGVGTVPATSPDPAGRLLARAVPDAFRAYAAADGLVSLHADTVAAAGGGQPHNNMQPYLVVNFAIALQGVVPSHH